MSLAEWERKVRARDAEWHPPVARNNLATTNKRLRKLAKKVKISNPSHLVQGSIAGVWTTISTTGTLYDLAQSINQGDDYFNRFGGSVHLKRFNLKGVLTPGSTATATCTVRITVFRARAGLTFAANMTGSYNPIVTGLTTRVLYDRFFQMPSTQTTMGFPNNINISVKLNHQQKFSGTAVSTTTGESLYCVMQSDNVAGTTAPLALGVYEVFFDPM